MLAALALTPALAADLVFSDAARVGERYRVRVEMRLAAPPARVYETLTDFARLDRLNPAIREAELLESDGARHLMRMVAESCVMFFCRRVTQVQEVRELGEGYLEGRILPARSDFHYGRVLWHVAPDREGGAAVSFAAEVEPAFWVPPLLGDWIVKTTLIEQARRTMEGLEAAAR